MKWRDQVWQWRMTLGSELWQLPAHAIIQETGKWSGTTGSLTMRIWQWHSNFYRVLIYCHLQKMVIPFAHINLFKNDNFDSLIFKWSPNLFPYQEWFCGMFWQIYSTIWTPSMAFIMNNNKSAILIIWYLYPYEEYLVSEYRTSGSVFKRFATNYKASI